MICFSKPYNAGRCDSNPHGPNIADVVLFDLRLRLSRNMVDRIRNNEPLWRHL